MARPRTGYALADGTQVPGVTTIIGRFKDSGALIGWAYRQGIAGVPLYAARDEAADVGTLVHTLVEADLRGEPHPPIPAEYEVRVFSGYNAWLAWWIQSKITVIATEMPLVSEVHRFGGTPDAIGRDPSGRTVLLDWKTSNGVYVDFLIQIAAYGALWAEHHPEDPIVGGYHLVRFAKESGDFAHHYYPDLSEAWEQFLLLRRAYDIDKALKKRAT